MNAVLIDLLKDRAENQNNLERINKEIEKLNSKERDISYAFDVIKLLDFFAEQKFRTILSCDYTQEIYSRATVALYEIKMDNKVLSAKKMAPFVVYGNPSWQEQEIIKTYDFLKSFERDELTKKYFGDDFLLNLSYNTIVNVLKYNVEECYFKELLDYAKIIKKSRKNRKEQNECEIFNPI